VRARDRRELAQALHLLNSQEVQDKLAA